MHRASFRPTGSGLERSAQVLENKWEKSWKRQPLRRMDMQAISKGRVPTNSALAICWSCRDTRPKTRRPSEAHLVAPSPIVKRGGLSMAQIDIKDLPQSVELDRDAMLAISGGARTGARPVAPTGTALRSGRIVDYPPGFARDAAQEADGQRPVP
jgi:hypothetical protein